MKQNALLLAGALSALLLSGCSSHSGSDISIAKQTKPLALHTNNVNITYAMDANASKPFSDALLTSFKTQGIRIEKNSDTKIILHPVYLGSTQRYQKVTADDPVIPSAGIESFEAENKTSDRIRGGISNGLKVSSGYGIGMNEESFNAGVGQVAGTAILAGVALIAIDYMLSTEGYELVTDVYINQDERTRIFAYVEDGSIEPEEALLELASLTADKVAAIIKGEKQ